MKIMYDNVSSDYSYPLSRRDVTKILKHLPRCIVEKIDGIRFGCNTRTTQEGRVVQRGDLYELRINICLRGNRTILPSRRKDYLAQLQSFGAAVDPQVGIAAWDLLDAKRYATYILLHEVGHIQFCETHLSGEMGYMNPRTEERWCDDYARAETGRLSHLGIWSKKTRSSQDMGR